MNHSHYDVVVIGGGPAGSSLSILLIRQGYRVLLLEREKFPRFHVGESLLPGTQAIWEKLGIAEKMQHLGNTFKYAGEFRIGLDPNSSDFLYSRGGFNTYPRARRQERPYAYQVDRAEFDTFLLNEARNNGVTALEEAVVKEILWEGDKATGIRWKDSEGQEFTTTADFVADCSGRHAMISRSRKFLKPHELIQTSAVFGQLQGVSRDPGIRQGYFNGYFIENGWMWFIPLHSDVMSVGVVMNKPGTDWWGTNKPEDILLTYINRYKFLRDRFIDARLFSKVRTLRGLPYTSTRCVGDGWLTVGDANFFVDPLYSSGVHIAFGSADKAATAIDGFLKGRRDMKPLQMYEKWAFSYAYHVFSTMSILYKMMRYRGAMQAYIEMTGSRGNHWDGFVLRRANAWGTGNYDDYRWAMYVLWSVGLPLSWIGKVREKVLGRAGWDSHAELCSLPPLQIPRIPDLETAGKKRRPAKAATAIQDENFMDRWIVPMDSADAAGLPGMLESRSGMLDREHDGLKTTPVDGSGVMAPKPTGTALA